MEILKFSTSHGISSIPAILAIESFQADAYRLPQVFLQIRKIFGVFPAESVIVLATKRNLCKNELAYNKRREMFIKLMKEYDIPEQNYL